MKVARPVRESGQRKRAGRKPGTAPLADSHWVRDLGTTGYDNGVLLCAHHHSEIHREQWEIQFAADGRAELIPPQWLDAKREPRRNTLNHNNPIRRD